MTARQPPRKGYAAILCFVLGWTGAHRFYVGGRKRSAVAMAGLTVMAIVLISLSIELEPSWIVEMATDRPDGNETLHVLTLVLSFFCFVTVGLWQIVDFVLILSGRLLEDSKSAPNSTDRPRVAGAPLQQRLLLVAKHTGGIITPTIAAMRTGCDIEEARGILDKLTASGDVELWPNATGGLVYVVPDLLTEEKRAELEGDYRSS